MPLAGARVLVTGGAGMIGSTLCDQLVQNDVAEVVVLDNLARGTRRNIAPALATGVVSLVEGDVADVPLVTSLTAGRDLVFHLAALRITQCAQEPRLAVESLVQGTFNVFEAAAQAGVRRVVFSSSASVYGMARAFPTTEQHHPYANETLYGGAKLFGEQLQASFHAMYDLAGVALRYFNVYGPRMDMHGRYTEVLIRWMERIASGEPPVIFGNGLQTLDMVHTDDVARANLMAAEADVSHGIYNIGSGGEVSLRDLAAGILAAMDRTDLALEFGPERSVNPVARRLADITRAREDLGWAPEVELDEGLRDLVAWWRGQAAELEPAGLDR